MRPPAQPIPASFMTTFESAEKSSRPYPAPEAAVSTWRTVAVDASGTPERAA